MSILDRAALEQSPLADLHAIASELSLDGYRRLRKPDLIKAIIERQGGDADAVTAPEPAESVEAPMGETGAPEIGDGAASDEAKTTAGRRRRGGRARRKAAPDEGPEDERPAPRRRGEEAAESEDGAPDEEEVVETPGGEPVAEGLVEAPGGEPVAEAVVEAPGGEPVAEGLVEAPGGQPVAEGLVEAPGGEPVAEGVVEGVVEAPGGEPVAEGVVEVLPNGSAFLRVNPPEPSADDVYLSAAQVKRCELVSGDRITGPRRTPRRSERFASLVRVDTINGRPAGEVAETARFDDLPAAFAAERFRLDSEDPTLKAIEFLTPFGRGSRVTISGPAQAGKTEALRRLAGALAANEDVQVLLVLAGARPEEIPEWGEGGLAPVATVSLAGSADAQTQAVERAIDQGRRLAARGNDVVVLIDSLAGLAPSAARRALAAARRIVDGGSLTVIAAAPEPLGGETTVIALDARLTAARRFPAVDLSASWTMRAELLVGEPGADLIVRTRSEAGD